MNGICAAPNTYSYPVCTAAGWTGVYQIGNGATIGIFGVSFDIPQPDPDGVQALILQSGPNFTPTATQSGINVPSSGEYVLSFDLANRFTPGFPTNGPQTITVLLDNTVISGAVFANIPTAWTRESVALDLSSGSHSLTFKGTAAPTADISAFLDAVSLDPQTAATPEPSSFVLMALLMTASGAVLVKKRLG